MGIKISGRFYSSLYRISQEYNIIFQHLCILSVDAIIICIYAAAWRHLEIERPGKKGLAIGKTQVIFKA